MKNLFKTGILMGLTLLVSCQDELTQDPIGLTTLEQANSAPTLNSVENSVNSSYQLLSNRLNILAQWDWGGGLVFQNDLILQDRLESPAEIYGSSRILLLMSRVEGTPNVVIEAQACGLAVAACDVGGVKEALMQDGPAAGLLLPVEIDPVEAAERIAAWLPAALEASPDQRRRHVERTFSTAALARRTLALYGPGGAPFEGAADD